MKNVWQETTKDDIAAWQSISWSEELTKHVVQNFIVKIKYQGLGQIWTCHSVDFITVYLQVIFETNLPYGFLTTELN